MPSVWLAVASSAVFVFAADKARDPTWWSLGMSLGLAAAYQEGGVLDHPTRRRIYDHLLCLPGDHFRSIVRSLRLGHGTARHHLGVLVNLGLVTGEKANGRVRYYARGAGSETERNELFMKHWQYRDLRMRVLLTARSRRAVRASSVARALGISRQLAAYHLERLENLGLLHREGRYYCA